MSNHMYKQKGERKYDMLTYNEYSSLITNNICEYNNLNSFVQKIGCSLEHIVKEHDC